MLGQLREDGTKRVESADAFNDPTQGKHSVRNIIEKSLVALNKAEEAVGSEGLHQALHRTQLEEAIERRIGNEIIFTLSRAIIFGQFASLVRSQLDVRIVQERRQIILRQPRPHPLEVDQMGLAISNNDVLRLKIPMHQDAGRGVELLGDLSQNG